MKDKSVFELHLILIELQNKLTTLGLLNDIRIGTGVTWITSEVAKLNAFKDKIRATIKMINEEIEGRKI